VSATRVIHAATLAAGRVLARLVEIITSVAFATLFVLTAVQVIFRYVIGLPLTWTEEAARWCFVVTLFLGASYVGLKGGHILIDAFVRKLPRGLQSVLATACELGMMWFGLHIMGLEGFKLAERAMWQSSASLGIPMGWILMAVPVAGVFLALFLFVRLVDRWAVSQLGITPSPLTKIDFDEEAGR
jgi:TRAP-type C4-dicarboxylate transport system permease small subunit